jgi:hypothetical protein
VRFAINQNGDMLPEKDQQADLPDWIERACSSFSRRSGLYEEFLKNIQR